MAFTEFYMQTTGSDLNSGTTSTDAATVTSTGGTVSGTLPYTFTAASGTPFSGVSVGDWCSLYPNAASVPVFYGKIASVGGGGASVTTDSTNIVGSAPATTANATTCKIGGAWASSVPLSLSAYTITGSQRLNIKAGTYSLPVGTQAWQRIGTATFPFWIRGYNASPGDLDNDTVTNLVPGTNMPHFSVATASSVTGNNYTTMSFIAITAAGAANTFTAPASTGCSKYYRCRFANTNNASGSYAASTGIANTFIRCSFTAAALSAGVLRVVNPNACFIMDCVVSGGTIGILQPSTASCQIIGCHISGFTTTGISQTTNNSASYYIKNTINGTSATNGILFVTMSTTQMILLNNMISNVTRMVAATSESNNVKLVLAAGYNYSTKVLTQNADQPSIGFITESASPYTSSTNLTPTPSAGGGVSMSIIEGTSVLSSEVIGAIERDPLIGFRR